MIAHSKGTAIVVLADTPYYGSIESAIKIRKYIKQMRNPAQLPKSVQDIIRARQDEATVHDKEATEQLQKAIEGADFYVDGEKITIKGGDAVSRINQALEYLVSHVYSELGLITHCADNDTEITTILNGSADEGKLEDARDNLDAAAKMEEYLEMQEIKNLPTSMADIQSRYKAPPYGWKEIDIACVAARLIYEQKVTIKYAGATIQPDNTKLPNMLRLKSEVGKTFISKRHTVTAFKMKSAKEFLREYFDVMDIPDDEDGLIAFIINRFSEQKDHYLHLSAQYNGKKYPDHKLVLASITLIEGVLSQRSDNIGLIDHIIKNKDALLDNKEDMQVVENFFKSQVTVFDAAVKLEEDMKNELAYLSKEEAANNALNRIRLIVCEQSGKFNYKSIPELNGLIQTVNEGHDRLLDEKRKELSEIVRQCMEEIHTAADSPTMQSIIEKSDKYYTNMKDEVAKQKCLTLLDGLVMQMFARKDSVFAEINALKAPKPVAPSPEKPTAPAPKKKYYSVNRQIVFYAKRLESEEDIDAYVESIKSRLKQLMKGFDGIQIN